ncbi:High mobility group like protein TDP-1 [Dictyocoela muelleri]|nr:High mobility group like protein TDP-1 [Dictyocoela muelleri]
MKLEKPTNYPKKPVIAYIAFSSDKRKELGLNKGSIEEQSKTLGDLWRNADPAIKEKYNKKYQTEMERFNKEMEEYKKTDEYKQYMEDLKNFKKANKKGGKKSRRPRSANAYNLFFGEQIQAAKTRGDKVNIGDIAKITSKLWSEMSEEDKAVFKQKAEAKKIKKDAEDELVNVSD